MHWYRAGVTELSLQVLNLKHYQPYRRRGIYSESGRFKPNLDCIYPFTIVLAPNGIPFGAKSIKV